MKKRKITSTIICRTPKEKPLTLSPSHKLPFEEAGPYALNPAYKHFRIGTIEGIYRFSWENAAANYCILAIKNSQPGNGHLEDLFEWFEYTAGLNRGSRVTFECILNERFEKHLIEKRGYTSIKVLPDQRDCFKIIHPMPKNENQTELQAIANQESIKQEMVATIAGQMPLMIQLLDSLDLDILKEIMDAQVQQANALRTVGFMHIAPFELDAKLKIEDAKIERIRAIYNLCKTLKETNAILIDSRNEIENAKNINPFQ